MSDWRPQCHKRKRHFKWSLILSRTLHASRLSLFLQMSQKSLCSSSGIQSRRTILNTCPRVEVVNFTDVPDDDTTLAFLIKLSYKGPLYKHTNMFVDHMHQPWRTLAVIINKCLFGKTTSNDKLQTEPEPESVKRKTSSKRRVKKKVTLPADDNIISYDPNTALELGKSISQTKAEETEAARQANATHARIITEIVPESAKKSGGGSSKSVVIQDTPNAPTSKPSTSKTKLKGAPSLTPEEQDAADIMQALKETEKQKMPKFTIKSTNKAALKEFDLKIALYSTMHANKSFNRNTTNHRLYHALMKALIEDENAMDKGVSDTVKDQIRVRRPRGEELKIQSL
ncbi:hypothetical protein Tco_0614907 [Tanacetum coccineum]